MDTASIVTDPNHYISFPIEPITFIMGNDLPFHTGNIIKYAVRAGRKPYPDMTEEQAEIIDLKKVIRYAEMRINQIKGVTPL